MNILKTGKISHFFFYVYHLSQWHFSSIPELREIWTKKNPLNSDEKHALKKISIIFKKYGFGEKYIGNIFIDLPNSEIKNGIYKLLNKKEADVLFNCLEILKPRLELLYKDDSVRLRHLEGKLKMVSKNSQFIEAINKIEKIFNCTYPKFNVKVFVLPESFKNISGSANTKDNFVTIELRNSKDIQNGILILLHEITHKIVRDKKLSFSVNKKISTIIKNNIPHFQFMTKEEALEELFLLSFFPDGFLAKQIYKNIKLDKSVSKLPNQLQKYIQSLIKGENITDQKVVNYFKDSLTEVAYVE